MNESNEHILPMVEELSMVEKIDLLIKMLENQNKLLLEIQITLKAIPKIVNSVR